jgi:PAS domain S-box-containing protein
MEMFASMTIRIAHALADEDWIIACVDPVFCELMGAAERELIGQHVLDITHPADHPRSRTAMDELVRYGRPFWIDKRYVRPDGRAVPVRNHVSSFTLGPRKQFVAAAQLQFGGLAGANPDRHEAVFRALDEMAKVDLAFGRDAGQPRSSK